MSPPPKSKRSFSCDRSKFLLQIHIFYTSKLLNINLKYYIPFTKKLFNILKLNKLYLNYFIQMQIRNSLLRFEIQI